MKHYNPELLADPERWINLSGPEYLMTEPHSGKLLNPTEIPDWLRAEPELDQGVHNIYQMRNRLKADVVLSRHLLAEDLGKSGDFEARISSADAYGYESFLVTAHEEQRMRRIGREALAGAPDKTFKTFTDVVRQISTYSRPYTLRAMYAASLAQLENRYFSHDFRMDGTGTEFALGMAFRELEDSESNGAAVFALHNAREWCMVARSGLKLAELSDHQALKDKDTISYVMTIGREHLDIIRKFRINGLLHAKPTPFADNAQNRRSLQGVCAINERGCVERGVAKRFGELALECGTLAANLFKQG